MCMCLARGGVGGEVVSSSRFQRSRPTRVVPKISAYSWCNCQ